MYSWDALGKAEEPVKNEDETSPVEDEAEEGRIWHVQAHARNSISCMKVDPVNGSSVCTPSCAPWQDMTTDPKAILILVRLLSPASRLQHAAVARGLCVQ